MPSFDDLFLQREEMTKADRARGKAQGHENALVGRMRHLYGKGPDGAVCGGCAHFIRLQYSNTYFKCAFGPQSRGPATDWRARWAACGNFEAETNV